MLKAASFISRFWIRYHWSHTLQFNQPLSATHCKNISYLIYLLIPLLHAVSSFRFSPSLQQHPQHTPAICLLVLRSLGEEGQTAGLSDPIPSPTKKCAKPLCILHRSFPPAIAGSPLPPSLHSQSARALLSLHSVITPFRSFRLLHKLQLPLRRAAGLPFICSPKALLRRLC